MVRGEPPHPPAPAAGAAASPGLPGRWTAAMAVGELAGFVPPAVTGAALGGAGVPDVVLVAGLTVAGAVEGAVLGAAQARVLARFAPALDRRAWVRNTAVAAAGAWLVGMGSPALAGASVVPTWLWALLVGPAMVAALLGMGVGQWLVLRRPVPGSGRWVPVTAGAWCAGVLIPVAALSLVPDGWPPAAFVAVAVAAAVAMAVVVGQLTGRTLARLLAAAPGPG